MNVFFYSELRKVCNELEKNDITGKMISSAYENILYFHGIARNEGLLDLPKASEKLSANSKMEKYFAFLLYLIVDGVAPELLEDIALNKYITLGFEGTEGLAGLMYLRGSLLIQEGDNSHVVEECIKAMVPEEICDNVNQTMQ